MRVVEVNDNDIYGKRFNGYDIAEHFNKDKEFEINQLVINKYSDSSFVYPLFPNRKMLNYENKLHDLEHDVLSIKSHLTMASILLSKNDLYKNADLIHYHQFHNAHLNLTNLLESCKNKPTIISFHDPWFMTGRCVHPGKCLKWQKGCEHCQDLNSLFDLPIDNCSELWQIKSKVLKESDSDIIVSSGFMLDMFKKNPYTKDLRVHLLPFGIDINKFPKEYDKGLSKEKFGISRDSLVIFFRSAKEKGVEYIVEALKMLPNKRNVVLLTCAFEGLLSEIVNDFKIIELGYIDEEIIHECYKAADIFLMPSLGESFGLMAVEAMASSLPVVIFNNTALPYVTNAPDVGILVKDRDAKDLEKKIELLINDQDERLARGKLGRELVEKEYTLDNYESKLKSIYKEAYERQKYKLHNDYAFCKTINYNNPEVKKVVAKLKYIYSQLFPGEKIPPFLKEQAINGIEKIKYSQDDVQQLILLFNEEIYEKIIRMYTVRERFNIRNTAIYRFLKKSKLLRDIVHKLRNSKYKVLLDKVNNFEVEVDNLKKDNNLLKNDNVTLKEENKALKKELLNQTNLSDKMFASLYATLDKQFGNIDKINAAFEYKLWDFNNNLNRILYEDFLSKLTKKKKFKPLVSIIIPVYNGSNYLSEAICAALKQTYRNTEVIVVNDGSNDDGASKKVALSFGNKIKYYEKENGGVSSALNVGIKNMNGDYFVWLSHDDLIDETHIEKLVEFASYKENDQRIAFSSFKIIDENGHYNINSSISSQLWCSDFKNSIINSYNSLLFGEINGGSVFIPKEAFEKVGLFDEKLRISQERDMWNRLMKYYDFINVPYITSSIRTHKSQVTSTNKNVKIESDIKNYEIISGLSSETIENLFNSIDELYTKLMYFYKISNNMEMYNKIKDLFENNNKSN